MSVTAPARDRAPDDCAVFGYPIAPFRGAHARAKPLDRPATASPIGGRPVAPSSNPAPARIAGCVMISTRRRRDDAGGAQVGRQIRERRQPPKAPAPPVAPSAALGDPQPPVAEMVDNASVWSAAALARPAGPPEADGGHNSPLRAGLESPQAAADVRLTTGPRPPPVGKGGRPNEAQQGRLHHATRERLANVRGDLVGCAQSRSLATLQEIRPVSDGADFFIPDERLNRYARPKPRRGGRSW